jgi:glyoxylase-like metal-dependent hydrolase (beta-lactamase superfamily II)
VADALRALAESGRIRLFDAGMNVSPEVTAMPGPGHTPGHTLYAVDSGSERLLVIGDAMYCPAQLSALGVGGRHDADPAQARRTRELITHQARADQARVVGSHFAGGRPAAYLAPESG